MQHIHIMARRSEPDKWKHKTPSPRRPRLKGQFSAQQRRSATAKSGGSRRDSFITPATLTFCAAPTCWKRRALICLLVLALMKTEWRGQVRARAKAVNHSRLRMSGGQSECTYGSSKSRLWTSACGARVTCARSVPALVRTK